MKNEWCRGLRTVALASCIALVAVGCASTGRRTDKAPPAISEVIETTRFADVEPLLARLPADHTLVVLDIDDTLLTAQGFFASDHWYEWQKSLPPEHPDRVPCKFDLIGFNTEVGTQQVTEAEVPAIVGRISLPRLQLTSRNPAYRSGTLRELKLAGYAPLPPLDPVRPRLQLEWPAGSGQWTDYSDGVFMTRGANKGEILLALLDQLKQSYRHVVLVDDGRKNIDHMQAALAARGIHYHGVWYRKVPKGAPTGTQVAEAQASWAHWQQLLAAVYPERLRRLQAAGSDDSRCGS